MMAVKHKRRARVVVVIDYKKGRPVIHRVKNPLDLMTALNAAGDIAMIREFTDEKKAGAFKPKRKKNPCPPHLRKFRFRKVK